MGWLDLDAHTLPTTGFSWPLALRLRQAAPSHPRLREARSSRLKAEGDQIGMARFGQPCNTIILPEEWTES